LDLAQVLCQLPVSNDPNILVGFDTADDAAVYRISDEQALVMTVDFFTPVTDDPYAFGAVAAANSLSDIYAKGVKPLVALNLIGFPSKTLSSDILVEILRGGAAKAREAGIPIIGGHSIDDPEPKYGLVVIGLARPDAVVTNATSQVGDILVLTKPLGIGILTTGIKQGKLNPEATARVVEVMSTLNRAASEVMVEVGVHAATDVTGFGLLGHLHEVTAAGRVGAKVFLSQVSVLPETWELIREKVVPGGSQTNHQFLQDFVTYDAEVSEEAQLVLCDAQTSGGLLMSVPQERKDPLIHRLKEAGVAEAVEIGEIVEDPGGRIWVYP
jgi:selenide,water dikinase